MRPLHLKRWWLRLVSLSRTGSHRPRWGRHGLQAYRLVLAAVVIALFTYLSPSQRPYHLSELRVGSIAPERINAPFLFYVRKSEEETEKERREAERSVPTVLKRLPQVQERALARLDSAFNIMVPTLRMQMPESLKQRRLRRELPQVMGSLSDAALQTLTNLLSTASPAYLREFQDTCTQLLADIYRTGVLPSKADLLKSPSPQVRLGDQEIPVEQVYSQDLLGRGILIPLIKEHRLLVERDAVEAVHELLGVFIEPNLAIDAAETERLRGEARRSVARIKRPYLKDEMIIDKNTKVTQEHVDALNTLATRLTEQERQDPITRFLQIAAAAAITAGLVLVFGYYLATREPTIYQRPGHLLLAALLTVATAAVASYLKTHEHNIYLVPTPLTVMLATILLTPQVGLVLSFLLAFLVGYFFGDFYLSLICALTAAIAVYSVRQVRHRNQFYRAMILLPVSYVLLIAATDLARFTPLELTYQHVLPGIFIGVAAPILTIGLLPIFESLFHITTDITLLELSDLNRPLLRELAINAPGTYTHSLIMANLSEAAAEAIGANPLLARVGCYYHDIGKMLKPEYYAENQGLRGGRNPHDHLTPTISMLIISSHVKDGLELAQQHGLPRILADLIPQHHGTGVIEYFYNRAIELGVESVRREDFRYDGPKPQTKEAGILMLADSVESATRTLTERTTNRVRQLVRNIIQQKSTAGELDECTLTLRDLRRVEDSFIPVLMGTLHGRVEYPWQREKKARKDLANPVPPRHS